MSDLVPASADQSLANREEAVKSELIPELVAEAVRDFSVLPRKISQPLLKMGRVKEVNKRWNQAKKSHHFVPFFEQSMQHLARGVEADSRGLDHEGNLLTVKTNAVLLEGYIDNIKMAIKAREETLIANGWEELLEGLPDKSVSKELVIDQIAVALAEQAILVEEVRRRKLVKKSVIPVLLVGVIAAVYTMPGMLSEVINPASANTATATGAIRATATETALPTKTALPTETRTPKPTETPSPEQKRENEAKEIINETKYFHMGPHFAELNAFETEQDQASFVSRMIDWLKQNSDSQVKLSDHDESNPLVINLFDGDMPVSIHKDHRGGVFVSIGGYFAKSDSGVYLTQFRVDPNTGPGGKLYGYTGSKWDDLYTNRDVFISPEWDVYYARFIPVIIEGGEKDHVVPSRRVEMVNNKWIYTSSDNKGHTAVIGVELVDGEPVVYVDEIDLYAHPVSDR